MALLLAGGMGACATDVVDSSADPAQTTTSKADQASGCFASATPDERAGVLAFLAEPALSYAELDGSEHVGLRSDAARAVYDALPLGSWSSLEALPRVGNAACEALRAYACDDRGLCEPELGVLTWNVEHFPLSAQTVGTVAEAIREAGVDLIGLQEVDTPRAFDELLELLPEYHGFVGREGFGTRVAVVYRKARVKVRAIDDLFVDDRYAFPRPALHVEFDIQGRAADGQVSLVIVHLKAQVDGRSQARRRDAIRKLDEWLDLQPNRAAVVIGDFNDQVTDSQADDVFSAFRGREYAVLTQAIAERGEYSYIPFRTLIDHIVLSEHASALLPTLEVEALPIELKVERYVSTISDHRPVRSLHRPVLPR